MKVYRDDAFSETCKEFARPHREMSQYFFFGLCHFAGDAKVNTRVIHNEQCCGSKTAIVINSVTLDHDVEAGEI